jgi:hypothetical protein
MQFNFITIIIFKWLCVQCWLGIYYICYNSIITKHKMFEYQGWYVMGWCGPKFSNTWCGSTAFGGFAKLGRGAKKITIKPHKPKNL